VSACHSLQSFTNVTDTNIDLPSFVKCGACATPLDVMVPINYPSTTMTPYVCRLLALAGDIFKLEILVANGSYWFTNSDTEPKDKTETQQIHHPN
jgi:hypothetical protein